MTELIAVILGVFAFTLIVTKMPPFEQFRLMWKTVFFDSEFISGGIECHYCVSFWFTLAGSLLIATGPISFFTFFPLSLGSVYVLFVLYDFVHAFERYVHATVTGEDIDG